MWPKAVELLLAIPFTLGFQTSLVRVRVRVSFRLGLGLGLGLGLANPNPNPNQVARLLAVSLVLEALYAWSWWTIPG